MARYGQHDRYRIPLDCPPALQFYTSHLFVPHSRRELLWSYVARTFRRVRRPFQVADSVQGNGFPGGTEEVTNLLREPLKQAGLESSESIHFLSLEDYQSSARGQRVLFLFNGASPVPYAIAKVTRESSQRLALEQEFNALEALQEKLSQEFRLTVPKPLTLLAQGGGPTVLLESFIADRSLYVEMRNSLRPRQRVRDHLRQAREWLAEFQRATRKEEGRFEETVIRTHVKDPLERFRQHGELSVHEEQLMRHTIQMAEKLQGESLFLTARQGDFWPRNFILNGDTVGVVDWEHFRGESDPFSDLFMFATSYGLSYPWKLGRWADPVTAFRATWLERTWLARLIEKYLLAHCTTLRISPQFLEIFFPVFLAERALKERESNKANKIWRNLFREYAQGGGSVCFG